MTNPPDSNVTVFPRAGERSPIEALHQPLLIAFTTAIRGVERLTCEVQRDTMDMSFQHDLMQQLLSISTQLALANLGCVENSFLKPACPALEPATQGTAEGPPLPPTDGSVLCLRQSALAQRREAARSRIFA